jgi:5-bromo-4-chloroindolyl phosphate hydrolysis protein
MDSLKNDLDYFVFFVEKGEINEPDILRYYRKKLSSVKTNVNEISKYHPTYIDVKDYEETKEILGLIKKYYDLTDKIKDDKESSWLEKTS